MPMSNRCIHCRGPVRWPDVAASPAGAAITRAADTWGVIALSEEEQLVVLGRVCAECLPAQPRKF